MKFNPKKLARLVNLYFKKEFRPVNKDVDLSSFKYERGIGIDPFILDKIDRREIKIITKKIYEK